MLSKNINIKSFMIFMILYFYDLWFFIKHKKNYVVINIIINLII